MSTEWDAEKKWAEEIAEKIRRKMTWCSQKNQDKIPYTTDASGSYDDRSDSTHAWNADDGLNWWTNGFWGGIQWLMAQDPGDTEKEPNGSHEENGRNETKYDAPQSVSKSGICSKKSCREEIKFDAPQGVSKSSICSKSGCREEETSGCRRYAEIARTSEYRMEQCLTDFYGMHHDLGFMFQPTAALDWRLTGSPRSRRTALHAANLLAGRFNPAGNFIRAWNDPLQDNPDNRGWAIIDSMMNLSLLYWAYEETGDPRFYNIAAMHADTVRKYFIREDGSSCHIVEFDPYTGAFVQSFGGQGYAVGSSWSRGQGWAVYGFTISYIHTKNDVYLRTAQKVADYVLANLREDGLVPSDFRQPAEPWLEDSCGACVIAGGLLELADCLSNKDGRHEDKSSGSTNIHGSNPEEKAALTYRQAALRILHAIADSRACWDESCDAIVQGCSTAYHSPGQNMTMVYADYFFIEAIWKLRGVGIRTW